MCSASRHRVGTDAFLHQKMLQSLDRINHNRTLEHFQSRCNRSSSLRTLYGNEGQQVGSMKRLHRIVHHVGRKIRWSGPQSTATLAKVPYCEKRRISSVSFFVEGDWMRTDDCSTYWMVRDESSLTPTVGNHTVYTKAYRRNRRNMVGMKNPLCHYINIEGLC
jgi:hypothetical protein